MRKTTLITITTLLLISTTLSLSAQNGKIVKLIWNGNKSEIIGERSYSNNSSKQFPNKNIHTVLYDYNDNLPLVGGVINSYDNKIGGKCIIVSTNKNKLVLDDNEPLTYPYCYTNDKGTNKPLPYRIIDCSNVNKEQFFCYLMALMPNTTYYVRACIIYTNGTVEYGNTETFKTPNTYTRTEDKLDVANVWNGISYSYTTFDLVTDEIIDTEKGFVFASNENPNSYYQRGTEYVNTCYKFCIEWNYALWITHATNLIDEDNIVDEPIISQNGNYVTIESDIDVYYEINQLGRTSPQLFSNHYTKPFKTNKGDIVKAYAINKETNFISYTNIFVAQ